MAIGLVVSLCGLPVSFGQTAGSAGNLTGRIFVADGVTPRPGVVVKAANLSTSQVFTSTQTDKAGRYALAGLPSGRYQIAVETGEGLYVNQDRVPVLQGRKTLFSLALNPAAAQDNPPPPAENPPPEPTPGTQPPAGDKPAETPKPEEPKEKEKKEKPAAPPGQEGGFWRSGWGVAVGLGGGALVLGLLADSIAGDTAEVEPPSPNTP